MTLWPVFIPAPHQRSSIPTDRQANRAGGEKECYKFLLPKIFATLHFRALWEFFAFLYYFFLGNVSVYVEPAWTLVVPLSRSLSLFSVRSTHDAFERRSVAIETFAERGALPKIHIERWCRTSWILKEGKRRQKAQCHGEWRWRWLSWQLELMAVLCRLCATDAEWARGTVAAGDIKGGCHLTWHEWFSGRWRICFSNKMQHI